RSPGHSRPASVARWSLRPRGRHTPAPCSGWWTGPAEPRASNRSKGGSPCMAGRPRHRPDGRRRMDAPYRIRSAAPADAESLVGIERRACSDPWSEASFREALTSPWTFGLVAETGRGVAGYLIGRDVGGTGEVLNLAVAPEFRRRGIGDALLGAGLTAFRRRQPHA